MTAKSCNWKRFVEELGGPRTSGPRCHLEGVTSDRKCESVAIGLLQRIEGRYPRTRLDTAAILYSQASRRRLHRNPNPCRRRSGSKPIPIALPRSKRVPSIDDEKRPRPIS